MLEPDLSNPEHIYLERCMDAFMIHLDRGTFDDKIGKWTVFGGEPPKDSLGFYNNYATAINMGYKAFGLEYFMVNQITREHKLFGRWGGARIVTGDIAIEWLKGSKNCVSSRSPLIPYLTRRSQ